MSSVATSPAVSRQASDSRSQRPSGPTTHSFASHSPSPSRNYANSPLSREPSGTRRSAAKNLAYVATRDYERTDFAHSPADTPRTPMTPLTPGTPGSPSNSRGYASSTVDSDGQPKHVISIRRPPKGAAPTVGTITRTNVARRASDASMMSSVTNATDSKGRRMSNASQVSPPLDKKRRATIKSRSGTWELGKTIGAGSMGKVKLARHAETHEQVAVKIVPRQSTDEHKTDEDRQRADKSKEVRTAREAAIVTLVDHPYICGMRDVVRTQQHWYMLFEYVNGGQMLDYIISHGRLKEKQARKFARQIASALDYCHKNSIVHRDLKIENILISKTGDIKIIDFGLSNTFTPNSQLKTFCGSLYFAAPELLQAKAYTGPEVDIWSFGIVLYVLVCGKVPFDDQSMPQLHAKIKKGHVEYPPWLGSECKNLISRMLTVDPTQRATMNEIMYHTWLCKGHAGPPDNHLPQRRPLKLPLERNVIRKMDGFDFGSASDLEKNLYKVVGSDDYKRAVYDSERRINTIPSPDLSRDNKKAGVFDFYKRRSSTSRDALVTPSSSDAVPIGSDPVAAFSPLVSVYYLAREKLVRDLSAQERDAREAAEKEAVEKEKKQAREKIYAEEKEAGLAKERAQKERMALAAAEQRDKAAKDAEEKAIRDERDKHKREIEEAEREQREIVRRQKELEREQREAVEREQRRAEREQKEQLKRQKEAERVEKERFEREQRSLKQQERDEKERIDREIKELERDQKRQDKEAQEKLAQELKDYEREVREFEREQKLAAEKEKKERQERERREKGPSPLRIPWLFGDKSSQNSAVTPPSAAWTNSSAYETGHEETGIRAHPRALTHGDESAENTPTKPQSAVAGLLRKMSTRKHRDPDRDKMPMSAESATENTPSVEITSPSDKPDKPEEVEQPARNVSTTSSRIRKSFSLRHRGRNRDATVIGPGTNEPDRSLSLLEPASAATTPRGLSINLGRSQSVNSADFRNPLGLGRGTSQDSTRPSHAPQLALQTSHRGSSIVTNGTRLSGASGAPDDPRSAPADGSRSSLGSLSRRESQRGPRLQKRRPSQREHSGPAPLPTSAATARPQLEQTLETYEDSRPGTQWQDVGQPDDSDDGSGGDGHGGIDKAKPVFLKGLFSVSTTSGKPFRAIEADISRTLDRMGVQHTTNGKCFKCKHLPSIDLGQLKTTSLESTTRPPQTPARTPSSAMNGRRKMSFGGLMGRDNETRPQTSLPVAGASAFDKTRPQTQPAFEAVKQPETPESIKTTPKHLLRTEPNRPLDGSEEDEVTEGSEHAPLNSAVSNSVGRHAGETSTHVQTDMGQNMVLRFEIYIVKVPLFNLHGIQFKKVAGGTWQYKNMAQKILQELKL